MAKKIFPVVLLLSSLSMILPLQAGFYLVSGLVQSFALPGFLFLLFLGGRERHWFDDIVLSALLSPVILTVCTLLLAGFGFPAERSLRIFLLLMYFLLGIAMATGRFKEPGSKLSIPWSIPVVCASFAGLIAACFAINPDLLRRSDAWYHASVTSEILARGVPPMEPLLANLPIKYMWYYHFFMASVIRLTHLPLFAAMGLFNVMAAFSFPYLVARYTSFFTKNSRKITCATLMAMAGLEAVAWFLWPIELVRALTGEVRGIEEIVRTIGKIDLNGWKVIYSLSPFGTWMVNMPDKFLTVTVFSYALDLFLLGFLVAPAAWRAGRIGLRDAFLILFTVFGAMIFHVIVGVTMTGTVIGATVLSALFVRFRRKARVPAGLSAIVPLAAVIGFALSLPFLGRMNVSAGGGSGNIAADHLHFGLTNLLTILLPLLILIGPVRGAFRKHFSRHAGAEYVYIACAITCLFMLNIFIDLPSVNESKFIFPLFLLAGPPVFVEMVERIRKSGGAKRRGMVIIAFILFLPAPVLTFRGFIIDRPSTAMELKRVVIVPEEKEAFEWLRNNSAIDAIVIENNEYNLAPVLGRRHGFHSNAGIIEVLGYDGDRMAALGSVKAEVFSDHPISKETASYLRDMGREIYVYLLDEDIGEHPALEDKFESDPGRFEPVFRNEKVRLYRVR